MIIKVKIMKTLIRMPVIIITWIVIVHLLLR